MKHASVFNPETISILSKDHSLVSYNATPEPIPTFVSAPEIKQKKGWGWGKFTKFFKKVGKAVGAIAGVIGGIASIIYGVSKCINNHAKVIRARASLLKEKRRYEEIKNDPRYARAVA